jgi:dethiobiotin synthetase
VSFAFFIVGTGTEVGKTHVACGLLRAGVARELSVVATKPVMSGVDPAALAKSDAGRLLAAAEIEPTDEAVAEASPWRFAAPLAPTAAARAEGRALPYGELLGFCRERAKLRVGLQVVESAGGIMSPIADGKLVIDLAEDLGIPVVLVAAAYVGAISHTLTSVAALEARKLKLAAVVVNETRTGGLPAAELVAELKPFVGAAPLVAWRHGRLASPPDLIAALGLASS